MQPKQFASDNYAGICKEAMEYIAKANNLDEIAYGEDSWTQKAANQLRSFFDYECEVFFVFNGTAANALALSALCQPYNSIICSDIAHIETDECGAPEFFSNGAKLLVGKSDNGKISPNVVEKITTSRSDLHYPKPKVISITQQTEVGTIYSPEELMELRHMADKYELNMHMDGARFFNALVANGCTPAEITWKAGVDVLCLGGTKNGLSVGEVVIFFNKDYARDFAYRCKQAGQLCSKMRFLSCQWVALLETGAWKNNATNANKTAQYLAGKLKEKKLKLKYPVQGNAIFVELSPAIQKRLKDQGWHFYDFIGSGGVRFMTNWSTTYGMIDQLIADMDS